MTGFFHIPAICDLSALVSKSKDACFGISAPHLIKKYRELVEVVRTDGCVASFGSEVQQVEEEEGQKAAELQIGGAKNAIIPWKGGKKESWE